jgi:VanZ family protein
MPNKSLTQIVRWAAVASWIGLIFYLSNQPRLPSVPGMWPGLQDIVGHFVVYGVLAVLLRWALAGAGVRSPDRWAFILAVLYGVSDEFHQSFIPHRHPDIFDVMTDAAGALFALAMLSLFRRRTKRATEVSETHSHLV